MTKSISPAQESRLGELAHDFELALAMPIAMFGGEAGREKQLQRIAGDVLAVFGEPVTFSNDAPQIDQERVNHCLAGTPLGRQILRDRGVDPNSAGTGISSTAALDVLRARGDAEPSRERLDKILAASPIGRQVLADRAKKARS